LFGFAGTGGLAAPVKQPKEVLDMTEVIASSYGSAEEAGGAAYSYWNETTQSIQRLYADKYYNPQSGRYEGPQSNAEFSEGVRARQAVQQAASEQQALQAEAEAQQSLNEAVDRAFQASERAASNALAAGVSARQQALALGVGAAAALTTAVGGAIAEQDRMMQQDSKPLNQTPLTEKTVRPSTNNNAGKPATDGNETSVNVPETTPQSPPTLPPITPPLLLDPVSDLYYNIGLENRFSFVAPMVEAKKKKKAKTTPRTRNRNTNTGPRSQQVNIPAAMGVAVSRGGRESLPRFAAANGRCLVQNFELVRAFKPQNGTGTATFAALQDSLTVNPGIATAFPWCSSIALSYSKFKIKFLRYMYIPSVPTSVPGSVYIYTNYDAADASPASLAQVMTADGSSNGPVWMGGGINTEKAFRSNMNIADAVFVDIDLKQLTQPFYYVRPQAGVTEDSRPLVMIWGSDSATFAGASSFNISPGNLYVSYIIEFYDPVLASLNA
jgi:hypothetical protein